MYGFPFMMPTQQEPRRSILSEVEDNIKAMEAIKKALTSEDKDKKKDTSRKNPGDVVATAMFFTFATPFVMLIYGYLMTQMLVGVLEALAKIKGLH